MKVNLVYVNDKKRDENIIITHLKLKISSESHEAYIYFNYEDRFLLHIIDISVAEYSLITSGITLNNEHEITHN